MTGKMNVYTRTLLIIAYVTALLSPLRAEAQGKDVLPLWEDVPPYTITIVGVPEMYPKYDERDNEYKINLLLYFGPQAGPCADAPLVTMAFELAPEFRVDEILLEGPDGCRGTGWEDDVYEDVDRFADAMEAYLQHGDTSVVDMFHFTPSIITPRMDFWEFLTRNAVVAYDDYLRYNGIKQYMVYIPVVAQ